MVCGRFARILRCASLWETTKRRWCGTTPRRGLGQGTSFGGEDLEKGLLCLGDAASQQVGGLCRRAVKGSSPVGSFQSTGFVSSMASIYWMQCCRTYKADRLRMTKPMLWGALFKAIEYVRI